MQPAPGLVKGSCDVALISRHSDRWATRAVAAAVGKPEGSFVLAARSLSLSDSWRFLLFLEGVGFRWCQVANMGFAIRDGWVSKACLITGALRNY